MTQIPVSEAKAQLTDLIRRAEAGEEIIVTRHGQGVVRLTPLRRAATMTPEQRMKVLREVQQSARGKFEPGFSAARSQDFLYDDDGLPG
ncbi:MAG TPA: type II toxin-antitoxin system prevent-host-death family antitoxin [Brevundimonas sp.]|jgi:prevent-host-death family protein